VATLDAKVYGYYLVSQRHCEGITRVLHGIIRYCMLKATLLMPNSQSCIQNFKSAAMITNISLSYI
jgi:hypothetical protein